MSQDFRPNQLIAYSILPMLNLTYPHNVGIPIGSDSVIMVSGKKLK